MTARLSVLLVFAIPVIASVALASVVMGQILQDPTLGSGGPSGFVNIVGLESTYQSPAKVEVFVHVTHDHFDCGNLYLEIRQQGSQAPISQEGFFGQCFAATNTMIPIGGAFSADVAQPGTYELAVTIQDAQQKESVNISEVFVVS